ncbi:TetR/AcrR family transcriptional regulator [Streptomyces hoynatensis]|uniref:TetR/AcrR family transcriptional regulator n=1 Tax=Streptomyces hoynatensis TaxID=1141874 RepID=A0A3A9Z0C1_9ACTN|nr:TetR/AcrR family transcriptional regulator [Streptomyces hoynatensis]RKN41610.1 TetR/AcrR family transcriptional regulator [Streptomyces hoynatensis]
MSDTLADARPRLRADAARNRERILAAARETFVLHGPDAPLDEIARRAGVGNATLYRHFPDRASLTAHVLLYVNQRIIDNAQRAMEEQNDPFETLRGLVLNAAEERLGGLCSILAPALDAEDTRLRDSMRRMQEVTQQVIDRAHQSGQLRPDVDSGDLLLAISRLTLPLPGTRCGDALLTRRHLQIFLDGLRTPVRSTLPGEPKTLADLKGEFC